MTARRPARVAPIRFVPRPPVGTKVLLPDGGLGTVVPTHRRAPEEEVDVMLDVVGTVRTVHTHRLTALEIKIPEEARR